MILTQYGVTVTDYGVMIGLPSLRERRALRTVGAQQLGRAVDNVLVVRPKDMTVWVAKKRVKSPYRSKILCNPRRTKTNSIASSP